MLELTLHPATFIGRFSFLNSVLSFHFNDIKQSVLQIIDSLMEFFLGIRMGDHFFIFVKEVIIVDLEVFDDGEFSVLPGEEIDEIRFGGGEVILLFLLLIVKEQESLDERVDGSVFDGFPDGTELVDKERVELE